MSDSKKKSQPKKSPAKKAAAKKVPAKKAAAKKQATKKAPAKKAPAKKAAPKKPKQTIESAFEAVNSIEAHELMHGEMMESLREKMMGALDATDSIKIDLLDDPRDTIVEWAKEWVDEESSDFVSIKDDKVEINLNAKNGVLKRFFKKFFKR